MSTGGQTNTGRMRRTVEANIREIRRRAALHPASSPEGGIRAEMSIATGEAILRGFADLLDRDLPAAAVVPAVTQALANGMATFVMTLAQGDPVIADRLIPSFVGQFERDLRGRCADPFGAVVTPSGPSK